MDPCNNASCRDDEDDDAGLPVPAGAAVSPGNAAAFVLVAVLTGVAFWRGDSRVGPILLALLIGMGLLL